MVGTVRGPLGMSLKQPLISMAVAVIICLTLAMMMVFYLPIGALWAQTPTPSSQFANVMPPSTTVPTGANGIVVEGLVYGCGTPTAVETAEATVYWLSLGWNVWTEMSIFDCGQGKTISQFESDFVTIMNYVLNNAPADTLDQWLGIMVDEEWDYGYSVDELISLNAYIANVLDAFTVPPTWFATESFSGQGNWTQSEFNGISYVSYPAPQIATDYMAQLTNSFYQSFGTPTLVTWSSVYPAPYDNEATSVNAVNGIPYNLTISGKTFYYSNEFCPGSCL